MRATRIIADLRVPDLDAAKEFYAGYLGLRTEEFNLGGWPATALRRPAPTCSC